MKGFVFFIICVLLVACKNRKHPEGIISYKEDDSVKDWKCYDDERGGRLCVPPEWRIRTNRKTPFVFDLDDENDHGFFVLIKHEKEMTGVDVHEYFQKVYEKLSSDSIMSIKEYSASQLQFKNRYSYYGQFQIIKDGESYYVFVMISEKDNFLFDFTLHVKATDATEYYSYFQNILYNYFYDGGYLFSKDDQLDSIKKFVF